MVSYTKSKKDIMMNKCLSSVLAAVFSVCMLTPAFAEHEWGIDKSTGTWGLTNDLWRIDGALNNGSLNVTSATPLPGNPDVTTLDISGLYGFVWKAGAPYYDFICWNGSFEDIKTLIISDQTYTKFLCHKAQMPNLTEVRTHNAENPHRFSIRTTQQGLVNSSNFEGDYEITDMSDMSTDIFSNTKVSKLKISGSYSTVGNSSFFNCPYLTDVELETSAGAITFGNYLFGYYGNNTAPADYLLRSVTLNGVSFTRHRQIAKVPFNMFAWCKQYSDVVDLPNCTLVDEYAFAHAESIPFVNLMAATTLKKYCLDYCKGLSRVVFGAEAFSETIGTDIMESIGTDSEEPSVAVIWNCKTKPQVGGPFYRNLDKSKKRVCNYVRKEAGWLVENMTTRPYVKHDGTEWCVYDWNNQTVRQPLIAMDTVFKVHLRIDGRDAMTTLMPGVSGENAVWTIPAKWFLAAGQTFGEGTVTDVGGAAVGGASATPDHSGLHVTVTLPASRIMSVDGVTQDDEVFVDLSVIEHADPELTVRILDGSDNVLTQEVFTAAVGTTLTRDYGPAVFAGGGYYFNNVLSSTVVPETAVSASFGVDACLTLDHVFKDGAVTIKIDRAERPTQLAYWNVANDGYSMSDGVWTFRCDFTDGKAVVADAVGYVGSDLDVAEVDFTKPIGTDGSSDYQVATLDWGATINGTTVPITANNCCGKDVVINGNAGKARTLVGELKLPASVTTIAGWGYCENLTVAPGSLAQISIFGKYALAFSAVEGALAFADNHVVTMGESAFEECLKLASLSVPALNSTIGAKSFYHCYGLKTIELGGVVSIGQSAFMKPNSTPRTSPIERVVLSPALTNVEGTAFYKSTKVGCVFDVVLPRNMPGAKSGDGVIGNGVFQDLGAGSIIIPFKKGCSVGSSAFHFAYTTNYIFWGKAPTAWAHEPGAEFNENLSAVLRNFNGNIKTDRMFTVSLAMDQSGWEGVATKLKRDCTDEEWVALNPPSGAFGWVMARDSVSAGEKTIRIWLCEGTSPWESVAAPGLKIIIR